MTRAEARAYVARWKRVNEFQLAERKAKTPTERFRELVRLMQWVDLFGLRRNLEREERLARDVWNRLRRLHRGNT
jgi:hypothetical protein